MVALVLHLWHIVAPGGKLPAESSSARSGDGIGCFAEAGADAESLDPGVRRDDGSEEDDVLGDVEVTSDFFFARAS